MVTRSWWDRLDVLLATLAVYAGRGALWASRHPEVIQLLAFTAGHPEVAAIVSTLR